MRLGRALLRQYRVPGATPRAATPSVMVVIEADRYVVGSEVCWVGCTAEVAESANAVVFSVSELA